VSAPQHEHFGRQGIDDLVSREADARDPTRARSTVESVDGANAPSDGVLPGAWRPDAAAGHPGMADSRTVARRNHPWMVSERGNGVEDHPWMVRERMNTHRDHPWMVSERGNGVQDHPWMVSGHPWMVIGRINADSSHPWMVSNPMHAPWHHR